MMDPELKAKWVVALRSGEFKQGRTMLHNTLTDTYCCLGVLCEITGTPKTPTSTCDKYLFEGDEGAEGIAIIPADAFGVPYAIASDLMAMNDSQTKSFNDIADYIETCPEL